MNINAFTPILLILIKFSYSKLSDQCTKSNTLWYSLKYTFNEILKLPPTQSSMFICPTLSSQNCCSSDMNKDMIGVSELKLKGFAKEKIENLVLMFSNDSYDLMNIFINDLENTKNDLNQLFSTTYGYNYKLHKEFFFNWFAKLKLYMQGKVHNISEMLNSFFKEMTVKIVKILIAPQSTMKVTSCHTDRLLESKPFQETDVMLKARIIRSYPPARLLANGIAVGRDVFTDLMNNMASSEKCVEQFNSAFHCMMCRGLSLKTCSRTCNTIMENCFGSFKSSDIKKLDKVFLKYTKSLVQLAMKLDNPFNFPEVNNKMNVQISTAIMNVQSMYPTLKEQIKLKCQESGASGGGLHISRKRRQASQEFYNWQSPNKNNQANPWWEQTLNKNINEDSKEKRDFNSYPSKPSDALSPFAKKIKQNYKALENYFRNQRVEFCSSMSIVDSSVDCWNGSSVIKNTNIVAIKETKKADNIEDPIIKASINQLIEITKRINLNLKGVNLDPETVSVREYKLYTSKKVKPPIGNDQQNIFNQKVEGSGDVSDNKFLQPNFKSEGAKNEPQILAPERQAPDKNNLEFPTIQEGSGEVENKVTKKRRNKIPKESRKQKSLTSTSTISTISSSTKSSSITGTRPSTAAPNQIPDDEDLNPSQESLTKNNPQIDTPAKVPPVIQPEGSGEQPGIPDLSPNKPVEIPSISTKKPKSPIIEGSGEEMKPPSPVDKPIPFLPMLPDSTKVVTKPSKKPNQKPDPNPDEDNSLLEGSGGTPSVGPPGQPPIIKEPIQPHPQTLPRPASESTKPSTESVSPYELPGKVPPEVWIPSIEGVKNQERDYQKTTPTGVASRLYVLNVRALLCQTTLIILLYFSTAL